MSTKLLNLLLLVGSFALYYVVLNPLYTGEGSVWQPEQSISSLRNSNSQYDQTLSQVESLFKEAETLKKQYNNIADDVKRKMSIMVPSGIDPVRLVSEVSNVANETGLSLNDVSYSENTNTAGGRGAYTVSFSVKTTYTKFKELMRNYETSMRLYNVLTTSFNVSETDSTLINYQVKLETYYMK